MRFHRARALASRPLVSVVVPCYNYGRYLPDAVARALDQQGVDVQVVIVDDASPDGSVEVARRLVAADPRVELVAHEANAGHIRTYNDGLARARGDYVTLVSADDLLTPDALTRAVALMEHHPRVGFVYGYARSFSGEPPEVSTRVRNWTVWPGLDWVRASARQGRCFVSSPEVVMRRAALEETDLYDPRLPHSGDFDMWLRTAARWDVGRVNGPPQALYRVHDANMHLTTYAGWATDLEERRRTFEILFDERAPDLPEVTALRPVAMRALAREAVRRARRAGDEADQLLALAARSDPQVEHSRAFARVLAGGEPAGPAPVRRAGDLAHRVRHHLLWRRERRYGL